MKLDPRDYQVRVDQARADYSNAKANDDRILLVKGNGAISQQDYDQSQATLLIDKAKLDDASNQLTYSACAQHSGMADPVGPPRFIFASGKSSTSQSCSGNIPPLLANFSIVSISGNGSRSAASS